MKTHYIALAFLVGMLTTFIILYSLQVVKANRLKQEYDTLLSEFDAKKSAPTQEEFDKLFNAYRKCAIYSQNPGGGMHWGYTIY
jgi:hypothetical protein